MGIDLRALQVRLEGLELGSAFIEHLGWSQPSEQDRTWRPAAARGQSLEQRAVAEWGDAIVLEVRSQDGSFPAPKARAQLYEHLSRTHPKHLVIFVDSRRTRSLWRWMRYQDGGALPRSHVYLRGQLVRHLMDEVVNLHSDLSREGHGRSRALADVADELRKALDTRRVRSRLAEDLQQQHDMLTRGIHGVPDAKLRHQYAWVLLNRLVFISFVQEAGLLEAQPPVPRDVPMEAREREPGLHDRRLLKTLLLGGASRLTMLGGSLFLSHEIEEAHPDLDVSDESLEELLRFAGRYSWELAPFKQEGEDTATPAVLGESLAELLQRQSGQPVPPSEVARYLCERALHPVILDAVNGGGPSHFESLDDLLLDLDEKVCRRLLFEALPKLRILDPACGPGVLLAEAMETLAAVYLAAIHTMEAGQDRELLEVAAQWRRARGGLGYVIRRRLLTRSLFGAAMDEVSVEAARSRLLLELLLAAERKTQVDTLPDLDFNILSGHPLVGLTDTGAAKELAPVEPFWGLVEQYRSTGGQAVPESLRDWIHEFRREASSALDRQLPDKFQRKALQFVPRPLHWRLDLGELFRDRGGFDAILTVPPWGSFDAAPPMRDFFRKLYPYSFQRSSRVPSYLLFIERALQLLRSGGQAAMFVPGSFYAQQTDRELRKLLLEQGTLRTVLGFSNEFGLLEEVHRSFRLCLLVLNKGIPAGSFEAAFRTDPRGALRPGDLDAFLHDSASRIYLTLEAIQRLSPDSLSIPEFQSASDLVISEKLMEFPLLETREAAGERLNLRRGLELSKDPALFHPLPALPEAWFCGGRAIIRYGLDESALHRMAGADVAVRRLGSGLLEGLHAYRLVLRAIARSSGSRTLTSTILPPGVLCDSTVMVEVPDFLHPRVRFYLVALFNSFTLDYLVRQRIAGAHITFSALMTLPIPNDSASPSRVNALAVRAARLICTTPAFDEAARSVGLKGHQDSAMEPTERARMQAEVDGLVAHLYGLTEKEFAHILATFPLVPAPHTTAARNAYRDVAHGVVE